MRITPPLIDSTMYLFSGANTCRNRIPAFCVTSSSSGTCLPLQILLLAPAGGATGGGCPPWARVKVARQSATRVENRCIWSCRIDSSDGREEYSQLGFTDEYGHDGAHWSACKVVDRARFHWCV